MKRFTALIVLFIAFGFAFIPVARAAYNPVPSAQEVGTTVNQAAQADKTNKEIYSLNTQVLNMASTVCLTAGCDSNPASLFYYGKSPIAMLGNVVAGTYLYPPADLAYWINDVGQDLGFIPRSANAQGFGFSGFSALLPLWQMFRNVAYFLLAAIMIVIGFMVMFRRKIDPKTVVTVQNALPRIVLTLILITFSYAIVGLLVDIMYVVIYLCVSLFNTSGLLPAATGGLLNSATGLNTTEAWYARGSLLSLVGRATSTLNIFKLLGLNINTWAAGGVGVGAAIAALILSQGTALIAAGVLALAVPALQLILALAMIFLLIRLTIFFVGTYINIVLSMLFGPIQILMEAVPGTNSFASWIQNLIANLAIFPVGIVFFMLSAIFAKFADQNAALWVPGLATWAVGANQSVTSIMSLISMGLLFAIPSVGGAIKEALKAKPFVAAGPAGIAGSFNQPFALAMQGFQMWRSEKSMATFAKAAKLNQEKEG